MQFSLIPRAQCFSEVGVLPICRGYSQHILSPNSKISYILRSALLPKNLYWAPALEQYIIFFCLKTRCSAHCIALFGVIILSFIGFLWKKFNSCTFRLSFFKHQNKVQFKKKKRSKANTQRRLKCISVEMS